MSKLRDRTPRLGAAIRDPRILEDIRIGLEEARAGKVIPHEQIMREMDALVQRTAKRRRLKGIRTARR